MTDSALIQQALRCPADFADRRAHCLQLERALDAAIHSHSRIDFFEDGYLDLTLEENPDVND